MPFKQIRDFLQKFENLRSHKKVVEDEVLEWCLKKTGLKSGEISVKVRRPNVVIETKNMGAKTAIFISQNSLFLFLKTRFGANAPDKILFK